MLQLLNFSYAFYTEILLVWEGGGGVIRTNFFTPINKVDILNPSSNLWVGDNTTYCVLLRNQRTYNQQTFGFSVQLTFTNIADFPPLHFLLFPYKKSVVLVLIGIFTYPFNFNSAANGLNLNKFSFTLLCKSN